MRIFRCIGGILLGLTLACQAEDQYLYEVNTLDVLASHDHKTREKSVEQYIATLYANLFQKSISGDRMAEIKDAMSSLGDKDLARQLVVARFLSDPQVLVPDQTTMRENLALFVEETYQRFLIRQPSQAELLYLVNYLQKNPQLTPEMVYISFILSEEYQFY